MKTTILNLMLILSAFQSGCTSSKDGASNSDSDSGSGETAAADLVPSFSLVKTATVKSGGSLWSIPVTDGTSIYVSTESGGTIYIEKFDQDLNFISETAVATASDISGCTVPNTSGPGAPTPSIADHKHIYQGGYHYIVFSNSGAGDGGCLYLIKLDSNLNRISSTNIVNGSSERPTNDMLLVGNGTDVYIGKYSPMLAAGHEIYKYTVSSGTAARVAYFGRADPSTSSSPGNVYNHSNGAAAVFVSPYFYLVAPETLAPGDSDLIYGMRADSDWLGTTVRNTLVTDTGNAGLATALNYDSESEKFIAHYIHSSTGGGNITRVIFDSDFSVISTESILTGTHHRPHGLLLGDKFYLGYDTEGTSPTFSASISLYTVTRE